MSIEAERIDPDTPTEYRFLDPHGNEAESGTGTAKYVSQRASDYVHAMASEGMGGSIEFNAAGDRDKVACVVVDYDPDPDWSWLEQDCYADDPEYCDVNNHVMLCTLAYNSRGDIVDSLSNSDFLRLEDDWKTGTFYRLRDLEGCPHLQEIAREMGLPA